MAGRYMAILSGGAERFGFRSGAEIQNPESDKIVLSRGDGLGSLGAPVVAMRSIFQDELTQSAVRGPVRQPGKSNY